MPVHVFYGEEDFLVERAADEFKNSLLSSSHIRISFSNVRKILDQYDVITIYDCKSIPDIEFSDNITYILIFKPKSLPTKKGNFIYHEYNRLKSYNNRNEVMLWLMKEGERLNIDLSRVSGALFVNSGNSLRKLSSEIHKLKTLTTDGGMVLPEVARSVLVFSNDLTPKSVLDAVCEGNTTKAIAYYDRLQDHKDETGWILAYLQTFIIQILKTKYLVKRGASNIPEALSVSSYIYNNSVLPFIDLWDSSFLVDVLKDLNQIETKHKSGLEQASFLLELEIIRLSSGLRSKNQTVKTLE